MYAAQAVFMPKTGIRENIRINRAFSAFGSITISPVMWETQ
jgi:hypothetical protein